LTPYSWQSDHWDALKHQKRKSPMLMYSFPVTSLPRYLATSLPRYLATPLHFFWWQTHGQYDRIYRLCRLIIKTSYDSGTNSKPIQWWESLKAEQILQRRFLQFILLQDMLVAYASFTTLPITYFNSYYSCTHIINHLSNFSLGWFNLGFYLV